MRWTKLLASLVAVSLGSHWALAQDAAGTLPTDATGRALNFDFEDGTYRDWTPSGDAFSTRPAKGDMVNARRKDMHSRHQGQFWASSFELSGGDRPKGTLTSVPFKVTKPWATFRIGGGADVEHVRMELVHADDQKVFYRATGVDVEDMRHVAVDLSREQGKEIYIRLVDDASGGWGHINFDDFRFHDSKPLATSVLASVEPLKSDVVKNAGLTAEQAIKEMTLPPGFKAQVVAAEPDIVQPVAFTIDDRGRLWVAEALNYPQKAPEGQGKDKILIFEDEGNGHWKRTVFMEGLNLVSGLEVGFGGVWVGQAPQLLYIPILAGEKPGKPQVLLDGFAYNDTHETLNSFRWGPDGWLYGCQGVFNACLVGKPGTPKKDRIPFSAAIWRYHPTKHVFEVYAEGGSNQWGFDWNEQGQMFMTCCVIPHLYQVFQGGRYIRQAGPHVDPYTFDDLKTIADHLHWATSAANQWAANNKSDVFGGGHAHAGAMIYLGDNWPAEYRNQIFMGNIHGNRMNEDLLERKGSGYVGHHGHDFLLMNDKWSRLISEKYGPDGGVYVIDWYDKQACHLPNSEVWDRSNGRIYKITYGDPKPVKVDLAKLSDEELVKLHTHRNEWYVRHARRLLQERCAPNGPSEPGVVHEDRDRTGRRIAVLTQLATLATSGEAPGVRLRALKTFEVIGPVLQMWHDKLASLRQDPDEFLRAEWVVNSTFDYQSAVSVVEELGGVAKSDPSPYVRLRISQALSHSQGLSKWWDAARAVMSHPEDATDQNLPLMYWYMIERAVPDSPAEAATTAVETKIPLVRQFIARRLAMMSDQPKAVAAAVSIIEKSESEEARKSALVGVVEGFAGKRSVAMPENWTKAYEKLANSQDVTVRQAATSVATTFGDPRALDALRKTAGDASADIGDRQSALDTLLARKDAQLVPVLQKLADEPKLAAVAVRGLSGYDDAKTPGVLIEAYPKLDAQTKLAALNTLASRPAWAEALVSAVDAGKLPKADLTSPTVRNLSGLDDKTVNEWIAKNWGSVKATDAEKKGQIAKYRKLVGGTNALARADAENGRAIFARTCMQCHTLFNVGAKIGPDLTGSNRADVNYLMENIVDPSAVIGKDYLLTTIKTKDNEQIDGIVKSETNDTLTIATVNGTQTLPKNEITKRRLSDVSMMPEGLLAGMTDQEIKDLIRYLGSPSQVAMKATSQNVTTFFDGHDLAGWTSDHLELWHVENGEIVGKTEKGIKHNNFLFSDLSLGDFRLVVQIKLVPNEANSGIQFRSIPWGEGEAKGYQADAGHGWWGKLYEESGRGLLTKEGGEQWLKPNEWNTYEIVAVGHHVRTAINGHLCVDVNDVEGSLRGQTGLQIHAGGPTEVRFKDFKLELSPKDEMSTVQGAAAAVK